MDLITAENEIVTQLRTISGIKVQSWPDDPAEFINGFPSEIVLVRYDGSNYDEAEPNNQLKVIQNRGLSWDISILSKSFKETKKHQGAYSFIKSIREKLTGFTLPSFPDATVLMPVSDQFVSETRGFHVYSCIYEFKFPEAEA